MMMTTVFAKQITKHRNLVRFKKIGHPAVEGFSQYYNFTGGKFAGYVETVANFGTGYRSYPAGLSTGRLFDTLEEALDYLNGTRELQTQAGDWLRGKRNQP